jgi:hypothetical protein
LFAADRTEHALSLDTRDKRQFVEWPGVLPVGPCFTSKGVLGRCTSFRQCYPYFKLPELSNWETWILGMYDTCSYFTSSGRQVSECKVQHKRIKLPRRSCTVFIPYSIVLQPVTTVSDHRLDDWGSIPGRGKGFVQTSFEAHQASCPMGTGGPSPRVKRGLGVSLTTYPI